MCVIDKDWSLSKSAVASLLLELMTPFVAKKGCGLLSCILYRMIGNFRRYKFS